MISSYFDDPKLFPALGLDVATMTAPIDIKSELPATLTVDTLVGQELPKYPGNIRSYQFPAQADLSYPFAAQAEAGIAATRSQSKPRDSPTSVPLLPRQRRRTLSRKVSTFFDFLLGGNEAAQEENGTDDPQQSAYATQDSWEEHFALLTKSPETFHQHLPVKQSKSPKRYQRKVTRDTPQDAPALPSKPSVCYSYSCDHWKDTPGRKSSGPNCDAYVLQHDESQAKKEMTKSLRMSQSFSSLFQAKKQKSSSNFDSTFFAMPGSCNDDQFSSLISIPTPVQTNAEMKKHSHLRQKSFDASLSSAPVRSTRPRSSSLFSLKRKTGIQENRGGAADVPDVPLIPQHYLEGSSLMLPSATERRVVVVDPTAPRINSTVITTSVYCGFPLLSPLTATSTGSEPLEYVLTDDSSPLFQRAGAHPITSPAHPVFSASMHQTFKRFSGGPQAV